MSGLDGKPDDKFSHDAAFYVVVCLACDAFTILKMSRIVRKPAFCICENIDADQLRGNREADQRLCFSLHR